MSVKRQLVVGLALAAGLGCLAAPALAALPTEGRLGRLELPPPGAFAAPFGELAHAPGGAAEGPPESPRQWASLPHEQRQQMRQQMREQWRQTPPDYRDQRRHNPGQWQQQLPQEDRSRLRDDVREHRGGGRGRHDGWR